MKKSKSCSGVLFGTLAAVVVLLAGFSASPAFAQANVINGNFSSGNSGFSSNYDYVAPTPNALYPEGLYTVGTNPHQVHNNWLTMGDHTSGGGNMFIANGSPSTSDVVWSGTVDADLTIGATYSFSAWVVDVLAGDPAPPTLTFKADGATIGTFSPSGNSWTRLYGTFTAGTLRPALTLTNAQPAANGNDFAVDDITIRLGTTTTLTDSPDPSGLGATVTLTATVSPSGATGAVDFWYGATYIGQSTLSGGVATITTSSMPAGSHTLAAYYLGDANYETSSDTEPHEVIPVEIDVQRPTGTSIPDGGTDNIGNQNAGTTPDLTYTVANSLIGGLHVSGVTATPSVTVGGFTTVTPLPFDIAGVGTHPLEITFNVIDGGPFSLVMHIASNDADENPYDISITGTGLADFGDAPAPYPTLLGDNGARHKLDDRIKFGSLIDVEADGQPSADADGDGGDESGVTIPILYRGITADLSMSVTNTTGSSAYLNAWIDWNDDGDWNDGGEQVATNLAMSAGINTLSVNVPYGATVGTSFGIFRLSTQQNLLPTGLADNGEVETFAVTIEPVDVTLIKPNGGWKYMGGKETEITWVSDPVGLSTVTLRYSTDWGATFPNVIIAGTDNDGSFMWMTPVINSDAVVIKVEVDGWLVTLAAAEDNGDGMFTIDSTPPTGTLIEPKCGDTFYAGDTLTVKWLAEDNYLFLLRPNPISIQYSLDNWSSDIVYLIAENLPNTGEYKWRIPLGLVSDNFEIKVRVVDDVGFVTCLHMTCPATILMRTSVTLTDSLGGGTLQAERVTLTSPSGGEALQGGSEKVILWSTNQSNEFVIMKYSSDRGETFPHTVVIGESYGSVTLKYSTDGGNTYPNVIATNELNDGSFNWIVPALNSAQVKVQITLNDNETITDASKSSLIIDSETPNVALLSPAGGEQFESGASVKVLWQATDNLGLEKSKSTLWVSRDGGSCYSDTIVVSIPSDSIYTWNLPENWKSDRMKIKMMVQDQAGNTGISETPYCFSAAPISITMLSPNGGEALECGAICPIQWTSNFNAGTVDLFYSTDGGANYSHTIAKGLANSGKYDWTIPAEISSSSVLVKAEVHSLTSAEDQSDSFFTLGVTEITGIDQSGSLPKEYRLSQNYPNPFNPETRFQYSLPKESTVLLRVFDLSGRMIRTLKTGSVSAGSYEIVWDGRNDMGDMVSTGIYIARLDAGGNVFMKKMVFVK